MTKNDKAYLRKIVRETDLAARDIHDRLPFDCTLKTVRNYIRACRKPGAAATKEEVHNE